MPTDFQNAENAEFAWEATTVDLNESAGVRKRVPECKLTGSLSGLDAGSETQG